MKSRRNDRDLFDALRDQALDEEAERLAAMSHDEVAREVKAEGGDPDAIARAGEAFVAKLMAARRNEAFEREAERRLAAVRRVVSRPPSAAKLPRAEMIARIDAARRSGPLGNAVTALFHKRGVDESSDEELAAVLDEIELLRELHGDEKP